MSPCWNGPVHEFEPVYWQCSSVMSSLMSNLPDADAVHAPPIIPGGMVMVNVPLRPSIVPVIVTSPRIMPGAFAVPEIRLPRWTRVQVVGLAAPPMPLPISDPDESATTALQVPDTDDIPMLPDGADAVDDGPVGPLHAAVSVKSATTAK